MEAAWCSQGRLLGNLSTESRRQVCLAKCLWLCAEDGLLASLGKESVRRLDCVWGAGVGSSSNPHLGLAAWARLS